MSPARMTTPGNDRLPGPDAGDLRRDLTTSLTPRLSVLCFAAVRGLVFLFSLPLPLSCYGILKVLGAFLAWVERREGGWVEGVETVYRCAENDK